MLGNKFPSDQEKNTVEEYFQTPKNRILTQEQLKYCTLVFLLEY